ncbi:phosphate acyltransferase PlsX [Aerococcaceae bacterium DSM 109653]|uniref:Phosphate acyltransferase n=1 Tax=Fundicoccus ignavus TaxID=2664442 RepID=A0A6I2GC38_9LACT|nr:phosphate acyltransferase PlsX [Fundicoccus ignavus]MRI81356.1 phosphate acyltransferase PlsX [Fundicoccus ignavus]MRI85347.1 phosphate acyltransferase PlsX [Fundicoccus ignavus]
MVTIAIDAMGGDNAPAAVVNGVNLAIHAFEDIQVKLFGDEAQIREHLKVQERVEVIHTTEIIEAEDEPVIAVRRKKDSSMVRAARAVKEGEADVLLSAGSTGALLASGLLVVGRIKNIDRPGLMPVIPTISKEHPQFILMDAGANADSKPINLLQHAILASYYAREVLEIKSPRVGLINNGTEAGKGNDLSKAAYELLSQEESINFIGNIEAKELLNGSVDVAVTDGFTGNAILKTLEGTSKSVFKAIKGALTSGGMKTKLGALMIKDALADLKDNFDDTKAGGAVMLGVKGAVIKAHGSSNEEAIFNAIRQARKVTNSGVINQTISFFED